ncbi:MAG: prepilin-type N-terminal cleavage/methylation domain-containing protein [Gemmatimonadales bacterium]
MQRLGDDHDQRRVLDPHHHHEPRGPGAHQLIASARPPARGFSLIEVMISVIIFSVVVLGLAGLAFQVARHGTRSTDQAYVMGELFSRVDRASTIKYDSLSTIAHCDTLLRSTIKLIGCTSIAVVTNRQSTVTITMRTTVPGGHPDTVVMTRSKQRKPLPLR